MKYENSEDKRTALYIRRPQEQALGEGSLEDQIADLEKFAKENSAIIIDRYNAGTAVNIDLMFKSRDR